MPRPYLKKRPYPCKDKSLNGWEALDDGWIKFNVDAAVSENATALTMVARNKKEEALKVWTKMHEWCSPLQAEAITMIWAIQLALSKNLQHIIIEEDAKSCFDDLTIFESQPNWSITTIISNIHNLCKFFLNCNFSWVRRCCKLLPMRLQSMQSDFVEHFVSISIVFL